MEKEDNNTMHADLIGKTWDSIVAYELHYHRTCYREYTRKDLVTFFEENLAFKKLIEFVNETVFKNYDTLTPADLLVQYNKNILEGDEAIPRSRPLLDKVMCHFGEDLSLWNPLCGRPLIFNNKLTKGEIIVDFQKKLQKMEAKMDALEEQLKKHNCLLVVADKIRKEIRDSPPTYDTWPPTSHQLLHCKTRLEPLTEKFLTRLLTSRKPRISDRKLRLISSIGQDLIYNISNGAHRTSKHTALSLCTKRRTSSKRVIQRMNKFGHTISYHHEFTVPHFTLPFPLISSVFLCFGAIFCYVITSRLKVLISQKILNINTKCNCFFS